MIQLDLSIHQAVFTIILSMQNRDSLPQTIPMSPHHQELLNELTRLNQALRLELEKCHQYIEGLETELSSIQLQRNQKGKILQAKQQNADALVQIQKQEEGRRLKSQVDKLYCKLRQKRHQVKKLETMYADLQTSYSDVCRQKESLQNQVSSLEESSNNSLNSDQTVAQLGAITAKQRETSEEYGKELLSRGILIQNLYNRLEEIQRRQGSLLAYNQELKSINFCLSNQLHESELKHKQDYKKIADELHQLQRKYTEAVDQVSRLTYVRQYSKSFLYNSPANTISALVSPKPLEGKPIWPVTKRITTEEHSIVKQSQIQRQKLQMQVKALTEQGAKQKGKSEKLKSDLIQIKLQYSHLLTQKTELAEKNARLQRQKSQLVSKLKSSDIANRVKFPMSPSEQSTARRSINKSQPIGCLPLGKITGREEDGQVPVRDKNNSRSQYICLTSSAGHVKRSSLLHHENAMDCLISSLHH